VLSFHLNSHSLSLISRLCLFPQSSIHGTNLTYVRWTYKPSGLECCYMAWQVSKIAGQTSLQVSADSGADPGGVNWVASHPPLGSLKLEIKKGNKTITEAILSRIVPISFCQVTGRSPPFQKSCICHWDWKFRVLNSFLFKFNLYALMMKWLFSDLRVLGSWLAIIWHIKCKLVCASYLFSELAYIYDYLSSIDLN